MESLERLLDVAGLRHPCDLDLLLFFDRHPDALITSELLAKFVGYDLSQVGQSLDLLVDRRLLLRSQHPMRFARLYRFRTGHAGDVLEILRAAVTATGRRQMRRILSHRQSAPNATPTPTGR